MKTQIFTTAITEGIKGIVSLKYPYSRQTGHSATDALPMRYRCDIGEGTLMTQEQRGNHPQITRRIYGTSGAMRGASIGNAMLFLRKIAVVAVLMLTLGVGQMWGATYSSPATKKYGDITFLDVDGTDSNKSDASSNNYLTYGVYYVAKTLKITTWYNCSDGSPASNLETTGVTISNPGDYGFYAVSSTAGDVNYGGVKAHSTRQRYFYVTGATSVAIIAKDNSSSKYTQLKIETVSETGVLSTVRTVNGNKSTTAYLLDGGSLDKSTYYKITITSNNTSNCYLYQIRFGKAASCASVTASRGGAEATPAGGSPLGTSYTLTCSASGGTGITYQWKQNTTGSKDGAENAVGTGATSASFSPNPASAGSYWYYCVATNDCGNSAETSLSGQFQFNAPSNRTLYLKPNANWKSSSAKFAIYYFNGATGWSGFMTTVNACEPDIYKAEIPLAATQCIFVRFNSSKASTGNWDDKWNQTGDLTIPAENNLFTLADGVWDGATTTWSAFSETYTITFAGNGNTGGSMSAIGSIACGANQALTANAFTKTNYIFAGWKADKTVRVGGVDKSAGTVIEDAVTLQNISSNITLTAQWSHCEGPNVTSALGTSGTTDGTYAVGYTLGTLTATASARYGGALTYAWKQYDGGDKAGAVAAAGTNNAATYSIPNNEACVDRHYFCQVTEAGCDVTNETNPSGALTLNEEAHCGEIIKVTLTSKTTSTVTGSIGGTSALNSMGNSSAPYKLNNDGAYVSLVLSTGTFSATDTLIIDGSKAMQVYYGTAGSGTLLLTTGAPSDGVIKTNLTGLPSGQNSIYIYRSSSTYNGTLTYMAVHRKCDSYSFHAGTDGGSDWVKTDFSQVGATTTWRIANYTVPSTNHFYVGQQEFKSSGLGTGSPTKSASVTRLWTATPTKTDGKWQGQMFVSPVNDVNNLGAFALGKPTGATGTLEIADNTADLNLYVHFIPDGYGIKYGSEKYAFTETATSHVYETDVVTLPAVSTNYFVGLKAGSDYVSCAHSETKALSTMATNEGEKCNNKKKIYLVPGSFNVDGAKYAVYDVTNSSFNGLMTDPDGDGTFEGFVGSNCTTIILVRLNSSTTDATVGWGNKWNQTANITLSQFNNKFTITSLSGDACAYTAAVMTPKTSQHGKFRMWNDNPGKNWMAHFIPYYHLTYNANGGSGAPAASEYVSSENATTTVSSGVPTRADYVFTGWNTKSDGTGTDYASGASITLWDDATVLYAKWCASAQSTTGATEGIAQGTNTHPVTFTLANATSWQWYRNTVNEAVVDAGHRMTSGSGYNAATFNSPLNLEPGTYYYYCVATNPCGTVTSPTIKVVITCLPLSNGHIRVAGEGETNYENTTIEMAEGSSKTLIAVADGRQDGITTHTWYKDGVALTNGGHYSGVTTNSLVVSSFSVADAGVYKCVISNGTSCTDLEPNVTLDVESCDAQTLSKVVLTSASAGTVTGYNSDEYAGNAVIGGLSGTKTADVDDSHAGNETGYKLNSSGSAILFASLKKGTFQAGDIVKVTIVYQNDNYTFPEISAKTGMDIYYGTNKDDATRLTTLSGVAGAGTYTYTLTAADVTTIGSKKGIGVFRHSSRAQNHYVYSVEIVGCREWSSLYHVTYNGNGSTGGSVPVDATGYISGTTVTVLDNTGSLVKTGMVFAGWNTAADGSGTNYAADATFTITADITLYAKWAYSLTYDANAGGDVVSNLPEAEIHTPGTYALSASVPTRTGYVFDCWNRNAAGTGDCFEPGASFTTGALNETLYAKWTPRAESCITITNFEISQHSKSDNKPDSRGKYIYGYKGSMIDANAVTMTITETNSKGQGSGENMKLHYGNDVYIYADNITTGGTPASFEDVTSVTLKVKLNKTAPTMTIKVGSTTIANAVSLATANTSTFTTFGPYSADNLDGVISIINNGSGSTNYDIFIDDIEICTASDGFTLSYNANGGTGTTASQAGTDLVVRSCGFTRSGYVFDHWNTAADDSGTPYDVGDDISLTGNTTLYAIWVEEMEGECSWAYWFTKEADATSNGKTNNSTVFTSGPTAGSSRSRSYYLEGTEFTFTYYKGSVSSGGTAGNLVVPVGKTATFYAMINPGGSSKSISLRQGGVDKFSETPSNTDGIVVSFENVPAGTYNIYYANGISGIYMYAAYLCDVCADDRPEISYASLIGCPTVTLTATNYTDGALLQWYKKNGGGTFDAIDAATGTTYTVTETGQYKLAAQKECRLETEPVSVTISVAVATASIMSPTTTYDQDAAASPINANVLGAASAATSASEYQWEKSTDGGSNWTVIDGATTSSYTPSTAAIGTIQYRVKARNNCNEGTWITSSAVSITVIVSTTVTGSWKVDNSNVTLGAKGYVKDVNSGGWYDVKATFTATTATPTITMMTDGVKIDNQVVDGRTITARVYVPASGVDTIKVAAAVAAVTEGVTPYSACEIILKLAVTQCVSERNLPVNNSPVNAGSSYEGWRYYWETAGVGKLTAKTGVSTIGQESGSYSGYSYKNNSNVSTFRLQTYVAGVSRIRVFINNPQSKVLTVSNVYYHTTYFTDNNSDYEITPTILYEYSDEGGAKASSDSYFDIILSTPMIPNSCLAFVMSNNIRIYGVKIYGAGASGTTPTIKWNQSGSATLDDIHTSQGSSLLQKASLNTPVGFKSIAEIQYSSKNPEVATVNASTGEVTILSAANILVAETCTIAAKLPASGCYMGSPEITYRVIVDPCPDPAPVISADRTDYCVGHEPVLTIDSYDGDIVSWYKDGVAIPSTEGLTSITVDGVGNYYVATHKSCEGVNVRSNSIVISAAAAPTVTVLHSGWHIRRGREIGAPIQLFKIEGENITSTTITWKLNGVTKTLTNVIGSIVNGIYQLTSTAAIPQSGDVGTLTGTITVTNECGQSTTKSTTLIVDEYIEAKQIAYVIKGTKGGGWTAVQDDNKKGLYTYLASQSEFDVTACNGYHTTVLEDLLAYYSQFDVVVLTDYLTSTEKPGSSNPGYNKSNNISYSDAFGCLVDVKPMLTTEAYVSGKSQWSKVGLTSNPSDGTNTNNKSLKMTLLCPAMEIFEGVHEIGDTIQVADALPGGSENKMLQGFVPTAARDFVFVATVDAGDGKKLICLCERQHEIRARMMVFGLNWHGSEVMNADGNKAVKNIIEYLLVWDPERVADCAIYFDNNNNTGVWSDPKNWGPGHNILPRYYHQVRIEQPCEVDIANAMGASMKIARTSDNSVNGANGRKLNGSLVIRPTGALTLNGGIYMVDSKRVDGTPKKDYITKYQVTPDLLYIGSSSSGQGALAFGEINKNMLPKARVALYSAGRGGVGSANNSTWQYVGIPYQDAIALYHFYGAWLCDWHTDDGTWSYVAHMAHLNPFQGYAITQEGSVTYNEEGTLLLPANKSVHLTYGTSSDYKAYNLLANSFTAPIDINAMEAEDFDNAEATIYIYNTGKYGQWQGSGAETTAGQYLSMPIASAPFISPKNVIPPMQGFYVKSNSGGGELTINYDRTVLQIDSILQSKSKSTSPLRAPRRLDTHGTLINDGEIGDIRVTKLTLEGETGGDIVNILTGGEEFTNGFDNGWDGEKWEGDEGKPQLAVHTDSLDYAVSSQPQLEGTVLNFRAGTDAEYVLTIATPIRGLMLKDLVSNAEIPLIDTTVYIFNSVNRTTHPRFVISRKKDIATYTEQNESSYFNAFADGDNICIDNKSNKPAQAFVYDTTGKLIEAQRLNVNSRVTVSPPSAQGVYIVRITNADETQTIKVTF